MTEEPVRYVEFFNPYKLFVGSFIPNWLLHRKEISQGAKLCYARLCQYAGKDGIAWPAQKTLAEELGCSEREVQRYLKQLIESGLIASEQRGLGKPNIYRFRHHAWIIAKVPDIAVPDTTDMSPQDTTDMSYKENQGRESTVTEPSLESEIPPPSPLPMAASAALYYEAQGIQLQVKAIVDIGRANGRKVDGGRMAAILKRYKDKTAVMTAFMEAIARNVAVIEDYTEKVLQNVQKAEVHNGRLDINRGGSGERSRVTESLTEKEAYRLLREASAGATVEGGGRSGPEAQSED